MGWVPREEGAGYASNPGEGCLSRWLWFHACAVVENLVPHGARIPSWPWALSGDSIPPPHSVGTGFSLEEGCGNVPHTGSWPFSDRGGISCLDTCRGTVFPHPTPDRTGRTGTRGVLSARFLFIGGALFIGGPIGYSIKPKMTRRVVHKTKHDPSGSP